MMTMFRTNARGMGRLPDWPDIRDYTAERAAIGALVLSGVPPAVCDAVAANYRTTSHFSTDPPGTGPAVLIERIRTGRVDSGEFGP